MARQTRRSDEWPTILWIVWIADKNEHEEPLCKNHRKHVFEHYPESARGRGRKGDQCSMCVARPEATQFSRSGDSVNR